MKTLHGGIPRVVGRTRAAAPRTRRALALGTPPQAISRGFDAKPSTVLRLCYAQSDFAAEFRAFSCRFERRNLVHDAHSRLRHHRAEFSAILRGFRHEVDRDFEVMLRSKRFRGEIPRFVRRTRATAPRTRLALAFSTPPHAISRGLDAEPITVLRLRRTRNEFAAEIRVRARRHLERDAHPRLRHRNARLDAFSTRNRFRELDTRTAPPT